MMKGWLAALIATCLLLALLDNERQTVVHLAAVRRDTTPNMKVFGMRKGLRDGSPKDAEPRPMRLMRSGRSAVLQKPSMLGDCSEAAARGRSLAEAAEL